jgi:hypothetical protein
MGSNGTMLFVVTIELDNGWEGMQHTDSIWDSELRADLRKRAIKKEMDALRKSKEPKLEESEQKYMEWINGQRFKGVKIERIKLNQIYKI